MKNGKESNQFLKKRQAMVETQLRKRGISNKQVLEAMSAVPRHLFVPASLQDKAYEDTPLPIGYNQTISQPYIVALMVTAAQLQSTDVVLEIGTGCGYAAAVLSRLVKHVYSVEIILELAHAAKKRLKRQGYENIQVVAADGSIGLKEYAPFNAILVTAGAPVVPRSLKEQLAFEGRLIIPVKREMSEYLIRITRLEEETYHEEVLEAVRFVPLRGKEGWS